MRLQRFGVVTGLGMVTALASFGLAQVAAGSVRLTVILVVLAVLATLALHRPVVVAIAALLAVFDVQRLGGASSAAGSSGGVSYSDAALAIASVIALPAVVRLRALGPLRLPLIGVLAYMGALLPSVILNQSTRADVEWFHKLVLVGGSLIVGAWIRREGKARTALRWLVGVGVVVAVLTIEKGAQSGFSGPAAPLWMNKNFVGAILCDVIVLTVVAGHTLELRPRVRWAATLLMAGGALAAQSRGSLVAAGIGLFLAAMLAGRVKSRASRVAALLIAVGLGYVAYASVHTQLNASQQDFNNGSLGVRYNVEHVTQEIWRTSPMFGVGMKYFNSGVYGPQAQAPNNVIDNELAESGVVGALGFVFMECCIIGTGLARRRDGDLVIAATAVAFGDVAHGMVDIYWSAGVAALPFVLLGMALADSPEASEDQPKINLSTRSSTVSIR